MAKVYKGTERVDKFFKHYGVKGMKWKNHTYAQDDAPVSTARTVSKAVSRTRERDAAANAKQRAEWEAGMLRKKRIAKAEQERKNEPIELEEWTPKTLVEAYSGPRSEAEARERAASRVSSAAKKRVSEEYVHDIINRRLKQNKQAAENAAKNAAGGAGDTTRIKDEITRAANERAAKERAGRADNGSGRKIPTSESEARAAAASYVSPALKKRVAAEYEEGLARNEREAKNASGGAGKASIEYTKRKKAEREAKNAAGGAGDVVKKKMKEKKAMEEIYEIVSKSRRSRK